MKVTMDMFLFWEGYRGGIIGHKTRKFVFLCFVLALLPRSSQVIALRGRYTDDCFFYCSRKVIGDISKRKL
jgi:hypothetical protein